MALGARPTHGRQHRKVPAKRSAPPLCNTGCSGPLGLRGGGVGAAGEARFEGISRHFGGGGASFVSAECPGEGGGVRGVHSESPLKRAVRTTPRLRAPWGWGRRQVHCTPVTLSGGRGGGQGVLILRCTLRRAIWVIIVEQGELHSFVPAAHSWPSGHMHSGLIWGSVMLRGVFLPPPFTQN